MTAPRSSHRLVYYGTGEAVRLGDRIRVRTFWVLVLEGVVCYIPGVSEKHRNMEYEGLRHVGIQLRSGELRQIHWEGGKSDLGHRVTLLERGQPYKPLNPKERLDDTDSDEDWEEEK